jgi:Helix-turn-helix domain
VSLPPLLDSTSVPSGALSLRSRAAALALGISERTLWRWTQDGIVPHARIGSIILYPINVLNDWLREQAAPKKEGGPQL